MRIMRLAVLFPLLLCGCICLELDEDLEKIISELTWGTKIKFLDYMNTMQKKEPMAHSLLTPLRSRRIRSLSRRDFNASAQPSEDELMKQKLFRLMHETVKDSDLKVQRAELVKDEFQNTTGFDLGYVIGDVTDKLNVMQDISNTVKRLYDVWAPVEHVNAYEQIANMAIEVNHLVDMVRVITATPAASKS